MTRKESMGRKYNSLSRIWNQMKRGTGKEDRRNIMKEELYEQKIAEVKLYM